MSRSSLKKTTSKAIGKLPPADEAARQRRVAGRSLAGGKFDEHTDGKKLLALYEAEMERLGQQMHDGLCQQITSGLFHVHLLKKRLAPDAPEVQENANRLLGLLREAQIQARLLTKRMRPLSRGPEGLMFSLKDLAEQISKGDRVDCRFDCLQPVLADDYDVAVQLVRMAEEGVSLLLKNAGPSSVVLSLRQTRGTVELLIRNDSAGAGEVLWEKSESSSMMIRARALGGGCRVRKSPGMAEIRCRIPTLRKKMRF